MTEGLPRRNDTSKPILLALFITISYAVVEVIGGVISGSLALLSDAGHMFTDVLALGLSLVAALLTTRKPTKKHTFGLRRVEILVALVNGITLVILVIIIIVEAVGRFQNPQEVNSSLMLLVSSIGMAANLLGIVILRESSAENLNAKGAYLQLMGNLLTSIGLIVTALLIMFFNLTIADPLISIVIGAVIVVGAYRLVNRSISILLEDVPEHIDLEEVERTLLGIDGIKSVHDIHIWTLTSGMYAMSAHIVVGDRTVSSCGPLLDEIRELLSGKFQIAHSTIELDSDVCSAETMSH
jgi:cobalt-zinc-cadmium efflux system protein